MLGWVELGWFVVGSGDDLFIRADALQGNRAAEVRASRRPGSRVA